MKIKDNKTEVVENQNKSYIDFHKRKLSYTAKKLSLLVLLIVVLTSITSKLLVIDLGVLATILVIMFIFLVTMLAVISNLKSLIIHYSQIKIFKLVNKSNEED